MDNEHIKSIIEDIDKEMLKWGQVCLRVKPNRKIITIRVFSKFENTIWFVNESGLANLKAGNEFNRDTDFSEMKLENILEVIPIYIPL